MKKSLLFKYYALVSQGFIFIVVLMLIGYYIGTRISKDSLWPGLLALFGVLVGVVELVWILLRVMRQEDDGNGKTTGSKT